MRRRMKRRERGQGGKSRPVVLWYSSFMVQKPKEYNISRRNGVNSVCFTDR